MHHLRKRTHIAAAATTWSPMISSGRAVESSRMAVMKQRLVYCAGGYIPFNRRRRKGQQLVYCNQTAINKPVSDWVA